MLKNLETKTVILASQSPRRQELLSDLGISFEVKTKPTEEDFPSEMDTHDIAEYLAIKKASVFKY
jgi:septum formation protein